jgi:aryl-alcohol dehydrogenase-like predicted oxidoreductase
VDSRRLGRSGIDVSPIALGTMMFGAWGNPDEAECRRMVDAAIDAGVTLFDTADMYDVGRSEEILGAALAGSPGRRERVVVATKVGNPMDGDVARSGLSRRWITQACEDSLRRLQVDHIDLYQMHRPDPTVPIGETLEALGSLVAAGKVRAIGTSTFSAAQLHEVVDTARGLGGPLPTSEQPPYSALARGVERDVLAVCREEDLGVLVWAPLNGGWLTGKYRDHADDPDNRANRQGEHFDHRDAAVRAAKLRAVDELEVIAADHGLTLVQLALAFVLDDPTVTAALIGPRTLAQLTELLAAGAPALPPGARDAIDAVVPPGHDLSPYDAS